jgi:putative flippase GtrA
VASPINRARDYLGSNFGKLWRYASVSVISTALTNALLFIFYDAANVGSAMECNVLATTIVTFPAYYLNRNWTWRKSGKSHLWREVVPFWAIAFVSLVISTVAVGITAHNADHITHSKLYRSLLINAANFVTYGLIWIVKFVLFNKYMFVHHVADPDEPVESVPAKPSEVSLETVEA